MRLISVGRDRPASGTEHFSVVDIRAEEIPEPSSAFLEFLGETNGIGGLNKLTASRFTAQVRRRYATEAR